MKQMNVKMKSLILFTLIIAFSCCSSPKQKKYYFLYEEPLVKFENAEMIRYTYNYKMYDAEFDTIRIPFELTFRKSSNEYFRKSVSFLDSIEIFHSSWYDDQENVLGYWDNDSHNTNDSLEIYVGEIAQSKDSVIFRKVSRSFHPWR